MRIVVIGAGKLGYSIAELLSAEQHDVIFLDISDERLEAARRSLDVLCIAASGTSQETYRDPDVRGADMIVAVTAQDETNLVACLIAKRHGVRYAAARIRDVNSVVEQQDFLKKNFLVDLILNPELIMALEIRRVLLTPAALDVEDFAGGRVRLFEAKIRSDSRYAGVKLKDLKLPSDVLAGMIFRDNNMLIPHGDDCLMPGDNAYFIGNTESIEKVSSNFIQSHAKKIRRALIIGAGRTGRALASLLEMSDMQIKIIDKDEERCSIASSTLKNTLVIKGDATNVDILSEEGAGEADVAICLTEDDKLNLMLALILKHMGAEKTLVRVARTEYIDLMRKVGIDIALSSRLLSAGEVLAFARRGGVVAVSLLEGAKAEAVEVIVQKGAPVIGKSLAKANLPRECLVCSVVRGEDANIANGQTVLEAGDRIVLIVDTRYAQKVMNYFKK